MNSPLHPAPPLSGAAAASAGEQRAPNEALLIDPRLRRIELLFIWGLWGLIAALTSINTLLNPVISPATRVVPLMPIIGGIIESLVWALITPIVFWLTRRYSLDHPQRVLRLALFIVLGIAVSIGVYRSMTFIRYEESLVFSRILGVPIELRRDIDPPFVQRLWNLFDFAVFLVILTAGIARDYWFRYRAYQAQFIRMNVELANARLQALQAQLNPHFLFNTLNGVASLIKRDPERAQDMLVNLCELLRDTLERTELEVSLEHELNFIEHYLEIMRTRFQDRLQVDTDIAPDALHALVPNLILQPLVENAIKHGIEKLDGVGHIEIKAERQDEYLVLSVLDNGDSSLQAFVQNDQASGGLGLSNTRARLEQSYGHRQTLNLRSRPEGGVIAEIKLPFHTTAYAG